LTGKRREAVEYRHKVNLGELFSYIIAESIRIGRNGTVAVIQNSRILFYTDLKKIPKLTERD
jgi:hypothetical protein